MAGPSSLDDLIEALAGAVISAQDRIEKYQLSNLQRYFEPVDDPKDRIYRPVSFTLKIPSMDADRQKQAQEERKKRLEEQGSEESGGDGKDGTTTNPHGLAEDDYLIPFFAIVSQNSLKIKDVEIDFEAEIGTLETEELSDNNDDAADGDQSTLKRRNKLGVNVRGGFLPKATKTAHVKLRVEGGEPTEGAARVLHHLTKLI